MTNNHQLVLTDSPDLNELIPSRLVPEARRILRHMPLAVLSKRELVEHPVFGKFVGKKLRISSNGTRIYASIYLRTDRFYPLHDKLQPGVDTEAYTQASGRCEETLVSVTGRREGTPTLETGRYEENQAQKNILLGTPLDRHGQITDDLEQLEFIYLGITSPMIKAYNACLSNKSEKSPLELFPDYEGSLVIREVAVNPAKGIPEGYQLVIRAQDSEFYRFIQQTTYQRRKAQFARFCGQVAQRIGKVHDVAVATASPDQAASATGDCTNSHPDCQTISQDNQDAGQQLALHLLKKLIMHKMRPYKVVAQLEQYLNVKDLTNPDRSNSDRTNSNGSNSDRSNLALPSTTLNQASLAEQVARLCLALAVADVCADNSSFCHEANFCSEANFYHKAKASLLKSVPKIGLELLTLLQQQPAQASSDSPAEFGGSVLGELNAALDAQINSMLDARLEYELREFGNLYGKLESLVAGQLRSSGELDLEGLEASNSASSSEFSLDELAIEHEQANLRAVQEESFFTEAVQLESFALSDSLKLTVVFTERSGQLLLMLVSKAEEADAVLFVQVVSQVQQKVDKLLNQLKTGRNSNKHEQSNKLNNQPDKQHDQTNKLDDKTSNNQTNNQTNNQLNESKKLHQQILQISHALVKRTYVPADTLPSLIQLGIPCTIYGKPSTPEHQQLATTTLLKILDNLSNLARCNRTSNTRTELVHASLAELGFKTDSGTFADANNAKAPERKANSDISKAQAPDSKAISETSNVKSAYNDTKATNSQATTEGGTAVNKPDIKVSYLGMCEPEGYLRQQRQLLQQADKLHSQLVQPNKGRFDRSCKQWRDAPASVRNLIYVTYAVISPEAQQTKQATFLAQQNSLVTKVVPASVEPEANWLYLMSSTDSPLTQNQLYQELAWGILHWEPERRTSGLLARQPVGQLARQLAGHTSGLPTESELQQRYVRDGNEVESKFGGLVVALTRTQESLQEFISEKSDAQKSLQAFTSEKSTVQESQQAFTLEKSEVQDALQQLTHYFLLHAAVYQLRLELAGRRQMLISHYKLEPKLTLNKLLVHLLAFSAETCYEVKDKLDQVDFDFGSREDALMQGLDRERFEREMEVWDGVPKEEKYALQLVGYDIESNHEQRMTLMRMLESLPDKPLSPLLLIPSGVN